MHTATAQLRATTYKAPAKINLTLHVCGRRTDGYHLLDSLVVFTNIGDRITVAESDVLHLDVTGPYSDKLSSGPDNLILRAARLLQNVTGCRKGAHICLEKNLPLSSGIGGGSSDAAATLHGCSELWKVDPAQISNARLAAELGADLPVCFHRQTAFMSGIGEILDAAPPLPTFWLVLANCGRPLATKSVFATLSKFSPPLARESFNRLSNAATLAAALKNHRNDLASSAITLEPSIASTLATLENTPGCLIAQLSGSGPTCFGLFADEQAARHAAAFIESRQPTWWVAPTKVLSAPRA
ncbi:MAG: 4-(cytidine 5'-diphospho)-2-C-methyl-D-erythritol kinase [Candidatus Marinimicrobia bacterium]|nr:4-(cytidine 5'-diphospho)-2-C-methyl-D-erythritol kinase [Candidatus Neomarinimicrobiota bacterium]